MNKDFTFPGDYYSFHNGVDISTSETNEWINKAVNKVREKFLADSSLKETFSTISSGNTKVLAEGYKQGNGMYSVFVSVMKGYHRKMECDVEF